MKMRFGNPGLEKKPTSKQHMSACNFKLEPKLES